MARKKKTVYDNNLIDALKKLPLPIVDERHNAIVVLDDDRQEAIKADLNIFQEVFID